MQDKYPKMAVINKLLSEKSVWMATKATFKFPENLVFPEYCDSNMLYGVLSNSIHNPDLFSVIVSDKAEEPVKCFYKALSVFHELRYTEFNDEQSEDAAEKEGII